MENFEVNQSSGHVPEKRHVRPLVQVQPQENTWEEINPSREETTAPRFYAEPQATKFAKYRIFSALLVTTITSSLLLAASVHNWTVRGREDYTIPSLRTEAATN
jgi:hypothetical protein